MSSCRCRFRVGGVAKYCAACEPCKWKEGRGTVRMEADGDRNPRFRGWYRIFLVTTQIITSSAIG